MEKIFATVLQSKKNVTEGYLTQEGGIITDASRLMERVRPAIARTRQYLQDRIPLYPHDVTLTQERGALRIDMPAVSAGVVLNRDALFAIDGTPATPHLHYGTSQLFAGAVTGMSYTTLEQPRTMLATTAAQDIERTAELQSFQDVLTWAKATEQTGTNQSWPTTFLEYIEREYAIEIGAAFTLIDGPICTQNLLTQAEGRGLLSRFFSSLPLACGVVKSIQSSTMLHQIFARALHPGEAMLIETSRELIHRRNHNDRDPKGRLPLRWLNQFFDGLEAAGVDLWRGVYRPGLKAFGFECDRRHLDQVIAMLWQERDVHHIGHEIPFLLNQVDAHLRATYNAHSYKKHLTYALGMDIDDEELFDELDERDLR